MKAGFKNNLDHKEEIRQQVSDLRWSFVDEAGFNLKTSIILMNSQNKDM